MGPKKFPMVPGFFAEQRAMRGVFPFSFLFYLLSYCCLSILPFSYVSIVFGLAMSSLANSETFIVQGKGTGPWCAHVFLK